MKPRGPKSRCHQGCTLSEGSREGDLPCLFQLLMVTSHPWGSLTCSSMTPIFPFIVTWPSLSFCMILFIFQVSKSLSMSHGLLIRTPVSMTRPAWLHFLYFYFRLAYSRLTMLMVSGAQQSNSAVRLCICILPQAPLPSRLPYNLEHSSLCYMVGSMTSFT